jgi:hypothetical protein
MDYLEHLEHLKIKHRKFFEVNQVKDIYEFIKL